MCADTVGDLKNGVAKLDKVSKAINDDAKAINDMAVQAAKESVDLQKLMQSIGDSQASEMLRLASVQAGKLEKVAKKADAIKEKVNDAEGKAKKLLDGAFIQTSGGAPKFTDYKKAKEAEAVVKDMDAVAADAQKMRAFLDNQLEFHHEVESEDGQELIINRSNSYYDTYYFVNEEPHTVKNWGKDKSTCGGELAADPIFSVSEDACAYACDKMFSTCRGWQYFTKGKGICLLFKKVETVTHYDMCASMPGKCKPSPKGAQQQALLQQSESVSSVPFPWKTKSAEPNATLFEETVQGMCTTVFGCRGQDKPLIDCSLMDHYKCNRLTKKEIKDEGGTLKMKFSAWLKSGKRASSCKVNPDPCVGCKKYSTCSGPYALTDEVLIKKGDVASYTWRSSGKVDNYEVFVGLYSTTCGLVDFQFQRGRSQPWKTFELFAPKTDKYYMKFLLASYDGSGGGAVGADMEVKDVKQTKASVPRVFSVGAKCMLRLKDYSGTSIKPDPSGKCKGCLKFATKTCLKPDGTFPVPPKDDE